VKHGGDILHLVKENLETSNDDPSDTYIFHDDIIESTRTQEGVELCWQIFVDF